MSQADGALPTLGRDPRRIRVLFGGHAVADSADVLVVREEDHAPVLYFPREDVEMAVLARSGRQVPSIDKGPATGFTIFRDAHVIEDAIWSFETPPAPFEALAGRIAFQPAHFEFAAEGQAPADWDLDARRETVSFSSPSDLAAAIRRASAAHHDFETRSGVADPD